MVRLSLSLRYSIPVIILFLGSISSLIAFQKEVRITLTLTEQKLEEQARFMANQTVSLIEYQYRQNNPKGLGLIISRLGTAPTLNLAAAIDENSRIISSTRLQYQKDKTSDVFEKRIEDGIQSVLQSQVSKVIFSKAREYLWVL